MTDEKHKPRNGELDALLGQRIRELRRMQGDSQGSLGAKVDLTFQQIQKYENGSNRVSALMLIKLAQALNTTPSDLLRIVDYVTDEPPSSTETQQLVEAFSTIRSAETRASILRIVSRLADA
jgi:transcriptional regulator with XRE-family HTH domain